jgi:hypothetical protein
MALTQVDQGLLSSTAQYTGFKNRIINGDMRIDQRNAGASVTQDTSGSQYNLDRWNSYGSVTSKYTIQQNAGSVTPPSGFRNYLGITSSSAYTLGTNETFLIQQTIEGYTVADLDYGLSTAKTITVSFWVRSSLTGTFGGSITNSAFDYSYPYSYTISAANTWEYKTITIPGPTAGTWLTTNGIGMRLTWSLGSVGTQVTATSGWQSGGYRSPTTNTSVVGTNGATWYVTGVQLEKGSTATSFDYRPYGTELALCQRYAFKRLADGSVNNYAPFGMGRYYTTTNVQLYVPFPVTMRTSPTSITVGGTIFANDAGFGGADITGVALNESSCDGATITGATTSTGTAGYATTFYSSNASVASILFSAEL